MHSLQRFLKAGAFFMFTWTALLCYSFVFDCEPISPEKEYELERAIFNRYNENFNEQFPGFVEWSMAREIPRERLEVWLDTMRFEISNEAAASFEALYNRFHDPIHDPYSGHYCDPRESQAVGEPKSLEDSK